MNWSGTQLPAKLQHIPPTHISNVLTWRLWYEGRTVTAGARGVKKGVLIYSVACFAAAKQEPIHGEWWCWAEIWCRLEGGVRTPMRSWRYDHDGSDDVVAWSMWSSKQAWCLVTILPTTLRLQRTLRDGREREAGWLAASGFLTRKLENARGLGTLVVLHSEITAGPGGFRAVFLRSTFGVASTRALRWSKFRCCFLTGAPLPKFDGDLSRYPGLRIRIWLPGR